MANRYFDFPASLSRFVRNTLARASDINNRLDEVSVGFDTVQTEMDLKATEADLTTLENTVALKANIASPTFTGTPAAPNPPSVGTDTTQIATTAWVQDVIGATSVGLPVQTGNANKVLTTNGTSAAWAYPSVTRTARTSNTMLAVTDQSAFIDITSGTFTQTFDAVATLGAGWWLYLRNSGTGDITLDPNASETIDGLTSFVMYPGDTRLIHCDGSALRSVVIAQSRVEFTANGTWTKPAAATFVMVECWGAGGGGGSGGRGANMAGGGGGGGGSYVSRVFKASDLSATVAVEIGAGGTAGAAKTGADGNGAAGAAGGNTTFGAYAKAWGGGGGYFGSNSTAGGGGGGGAFSEGTNGSTTSVQGGYPSLPSSGIGAAGGGSGGSTIGFPGGTGGGGGGGNVYNGTSHPGGASVWGGGGGGAGASNGTGGALAGGAGGAGNGTMPQANTYYAGGGAAGTTAGTAGTAGSAFCGGGGGGWNNSTTSGAGGAGGTAAGGGGGAASVSGTNSGAGGAGGDGKVIVYTW